MAEASFANQIDARFPYDDLRATRRPIAEGGGWRASVARVCAPVAPAYPEEGFDVRQLM